MDNINVDSSPSEQGIDKNKQQIPYRKSYRFSAKLISFLTLCIILLSSVVTVNLATINSAEAKSQSAEQQAKKKKYIKSSRKNRRYKKSRKGKRRYRKGKKRYYKSRYKTRSKTRYKKSKRYRKGKRVYNSRYKKSRRYRKGKRVYNSRYKKSRRYRKSKRFYKTSYKQSNRYRKGKKRYKKSRKKRRYTGKRRYRTCDQLSSSTLHKKARRYQGSISHASKKYGVNQNLIKAVITVETCFRSGLRGTSGEKGLMQLMPATAKRFGVKNRFSSWENIHGGTRYLRYLLKRFDGNKAYAAAAYNGGSGAVSRKNGPKFYAVRNYSRMVMNAYRKFKPRRIKVKGRKRKVKKTKS